MGRDILDLLKIKEGEMEVFIETARSEASRLKEEAIEKATTLKAEEESIISTELTRIEEVALKAMNKEAGGVTDDARRDSNTIRDRAEEKRREAIDRVCEILLEV